jgi:hypothetical protein
MFELAGSVVGHDEGLVSSSVLPNPPKPPESFVWSGCENTGIAELI